MGLSETYRFTRSKGAGAIFWDLVFYLLVGLVITLSVQMGGIVLVFAYLIIPATISAVFASRLKSQLIIIWIAGISASIFGLLFAYYLDFSVGPAIALLLGVELIIAAVIGKFITI
jgi:zinc/manganese transport system permease protein